MIATRPETAPVAMLEPFSFRYFDVPSWMTSQGYSIARVLPSTSFEIMAWPGATMSGFAMASNHDGPRELYPVTRSSARVTVALVSAAPTEIADGALPGD